MLTLEDCIALSDLTPEEIDAIAEHEHVPETIAAELGCYLAHCPDGRQTIRAMILDDIAAARGRGDMRHAVELKLVLHRALPSQSGAVRSMGRANDWPSVEGRPRPRRGRPCV